MDQKIYQREELNTFDEVLKEFNALRKEIVEEFCKSELCLTKISTVTGAVFETIDDRFTNLEKRLEALEPKKKAPPKKPKVKTPLKKKKK